jgi:hypothetical protein
MRFVQRITTVLALLFGMLGLLALLSLRSVPVYSGPGRVATTNGDADCDGRLTIADPVQILNHLFLGGAPPCAIAQGEGSCCAELTSILEKLTTPGGTSLRALTTPCGEVGRYVRNGDGTTTDACTGLMWQSGWATADFDLNGVPDQVFNFNQAVLLAEESEVAGHTDWRLPTADEAETLLRYVVEKPFNMPALAGFDLVFQERYWASTEWGPPQYSEAFSVNFSRQNPDLMPWGKSQPARVLLVRGGAAQPEG